MLIGILSVGQIYVTFLPIYSVPLSVSQWAGRYVDDVNDLSMCRVIAMTMTHPVREKGRLEYCT